MNAYKVGLNDKNYNEIYEGAKVKIPTGQVGEVSYEVGAFGVGIDDCIDYDLIQEVMDSDSNCCGNRYYGVFNDNFISLWELYFNFNCKENNLHVVEIMEG